MLITVIDYGSGNLRSATKAFEAAAQDRADVRVLLTDKAEDVLKADRIVLPGQGAFADCMKGLSAVPGMLDALHETVIHKARPFFGICVGMQLLATRGLEHGVHNGLGWIAGEVRKLEIEEHTAQTHRAENTQGGLQDLRPSGCASGAGPVAETAEAAQMIGAGPVAETAEAAQIIGAERMAQLKIPHMGWNAIHPSKPAHPLLNALPENPYVYFVHSYALYLENKSDALASCDYGGSFTAAVVKNNIAGTQFHPEKSQKIGLQMVRNFINWMP